MELKKPTTFDEQIKLLEDKHIIIDDYNDCYDFLTKTNYYRFSAYYLPFKGHDGKCISDISFHRLNKIYEFDKKLRSLILSAVESIEIAMRTQMAYHHSHKYGPSGYMSPNCYNAKHNHAAFINHVSSCIKENEKTLVVKHHMEKYDGQFPIWVIIEFFSIGMLSYFYRGMKTSDKKVIAKKLFGENTSHFNVDSWVRCLTDLRNKCAHYSRLYYTVFPATPKMPKDIKYIPTRRLFAQIYMLKFMYPNTSEWKKDFVKPLQKLIKEYKPYIDLKHLDFPYRWKSMLLK